MILTRSSGVRACPCRHLQFITGYPAHEYQMRAAVKEVLGQEKYEYFFDKVRWRVQP